MTSNNKILYDIFNTLNINMEDIPLLHHLQDIYHTIKNEYNFNENDNNNDNNDNNIDIFNDNSNKYNDNHDKKNINTFNNIKISLNNIITNKTTPTAISYNISSIELYILNNINYIILYTIEFSKDKFKIKNIIRYSNKEDRIKLLEIIYKEYHRIEDKENITVILKESKNIGRYIKKILKKISLNNNDKNNNNSNDNNDDRINNNSIDNTINTNILSSKNLFKNINIRGNREYYISLDKNNTLKNILLNIKYINSESVFFIKKIIKYFNIKKLIEYRNILKNNDIVLFINNRIILDNNNCNDGCNINISNDNRNVHKILHDDNNNDYNKIISDDNNMSNICNDILTYTNLDNLSKNDIYYLLHSNEYIRIEYFKCINSIELLYYFIKINQEIENKENIIEIGKEIKNKYYLFHCQTINHNDNNSIDNNNKDNVIKNIIDIVINMLRSSIMVKRYLGIIYINFMLEYNIIDINRVKDYKYLIYDSYEEIRNKVLNKYIKLINENCNDDSNENNNNENDNIYINNNCNINNNDNDGNNYNCIAIEEIYNKIYSGNYNDVYGIINYLKYYDNCISIQLNIKNNKYKNNCKNDIDNYSSIYYNDYRKYNRNNYTHINNGNLTYTNPEDITNSYNNKLIITIEKISFGSILLLSSFKIFNLSEEHIIYSLKSKDWRMVKEISVYIKKYIIECKDISYIIYLEDILYKCKHLGLVYSVGQDIIELYNNYGKDNNNRLKNYNNNNKEANIIDNNDITGGDNIFVKDKFPLDRIKYNITRIKNIKISVFRICGIPYLFLCKKYYSYILYKIYRLLAEEEDNERIILYLNVIKEIFKRKDIKEYYYEYNHNKDNNKKYKDISSNKNNNTENNTDITYTNLNDIKKIIEDIHNLNITTNDTLLLSLFDNILSKIYYKCWKVKNNAISTLIIMFNSILINVNDKSLFKKILLEHKYLGYVVICLLERIGLENKEIIELRKIYKEDKYIIFKLDKIENKKKKSIFIDSERKR